MRVTARTTGARVAALLLCLAVSSGCGAAHGSKSETALGYLGKIRIEGYESVRNFYEKAAIGIYVGRSPQDTVPAASGPSLTFSEPRVDFSRPVFQHLADGVGYTGDGVECHVTMLRLKPGTHPFPSWKLSDEDTQAVIRGDSDIVRAEVLCAPFDT